MPTSTFQQAPQTVYPLFNFAADMRIFMAYACVPTSIVSESGMIAVKGCDVVKPDDVETLRSRGWYREGRFDWYIEPTTAS